MSANIIWILFLLMAIGIPILFALYASMKRRRQFRKLKGRIGDKGLG